MKRKIQSRERSFTLIVERDPESGWLVGEIVELPGCLTEAPDLPALEAAIREAIEGYLEVADKGKSRITNYEFLIPNS